LAAAAASAAASCAFAAVHVREPHRLLLGGQRGQVIEVAGLLVGQVREDRDLLGLDREDVFLDPRVRVEDAVARFLGRVVRLEVDRAALQQVVDLAVLARDVDQLLGPLRNLAGLVADRVGVADRDPERITERRTGGRRVRPQPGGVGVGDRGDLAQRFGVAPDGVLSGGGAVDLALQGVAHVRDRVRGFGRFLGGPDHGIGDEAERHGLLRGRNDVLRSEKRGEFIRLCGHRGRRDVHLSGKRGLGHG